MSLTSNQTVMPKNKDTTVPPGKRDYGQYFLIVSCVIVVVFAGCRLFGSRGATENAAFYGRTVPNFTLKDVEGNDFAWSDVKGTPVVLAFWAMGCGPCVAEAPHLSDLAKEFRDKGVTVIGVNAWDEPPAEIKAFAAKRKLEHRLLSMGSGLGDAMEVEFLPTVMWVGKDGKVVTALTGSANEKELREKTEQLLLRGS